MQGTWMEVRLKYFFHALKRHSNSGFFLKENELLRVLNLNREILEYKFSFSPLPRSLTKFVRELFTEHKERTLD